MIHLSRARIGVAVVAVLPLGLGLYAFCARTRPEPLIRTSGIMEAVETNLAPKVAGRIEEICCQEGDLVQAGQVVIRPESADLQAAVEQAKAGVDRANEAVRVAESSVEYAKATLESAQNDIQVSQAEVDKARAQMAEAERKMHRYRELYADNVISRDALEDTATAREAAEADYAAASSKLAATKAKKAAALAQVDTAEKQLRLAKADLEQANATLSYSRAKRADTTLTSPISGTVVFKALEEGETVGPGVTVLTIDDLSRIYARVDIEETSIGYVVLGGEATVRTVGKPAKAFKGRVSEIGRYAEFATEKDVKGGRQDIKTFRVKIAVEDPTGFLKPGMTVEVEIPRGLGDDRASQGR
jgi:HlyD family secretion protein